LRLLTVQLRLAGNALAAGGELEAAISKYQEVCSTTRFLGLAASYVTDVDELQCE
jgi:hypothetical protein